MRFASAGKVSAGSADQSPALTTSSTTNQDSPTRTITLTREEDSEWQVARDGETGVASQGRSRQDALETLDEAVARHDGEIGPSTDEELREMGIDPDDNVSGDGLPDVLKEGTIAMVTRDFSGDDVGRVLVTVGNYRVDRVRGDHAVLKWDATTEPCCPLVGTEDSASTGRTRRGGDHLSRSKSLPLQ